jgi:cobalt-zinc-cadmium efflux system outer membrane protein
MTACLMASLMVRSGLEGTLTPSPSGSMPGSRGRAVRTLLSLLAAIACGACATPGRAPDRDSVNAAVRARTSHGIGDTADGSLPPGVALDDGLTEGEAVSIALWSSPSFQATLADLGVARADLAEAGLLRNPSFSLLFPIGPKQLEWTLQMPFDAIWQRPRRVAAARLNAQAVAERLVWGALSLVADTRTAHADAITAERRLQLTIENTELARQVGIITEARLQAGDISDLEARAVRSGEARMVALRRAVEHDRNLARLNLAAQLGMNTPADRIHAVAVPSPDVPSCDADASRLDAALASRPDVRAAEMGIEAAAARARWERSRVLTLIGILDGNGEGRDGAEVGPGLGAEVPLFARNQGGIGRADAEVERASRQYAAVRAQVVADVRSAEVRLEQARQSVAAWQDHIVPSLEIERRQAESAFQAGEIPLFMLLDASRRLIEGRMMLLDAEANVRRAVIALERSIGRMCPQP